MIPIEKEPKELFEEFGFYEVCIFCKNKTNMWHEKRTPVCKGCAKTHGGSEIKKD